MQEIQITQGLTKTQSRVTKKDQNLKTRLHLTKQAREFRSNFSRTYARDTTVNNDHRKVKKLSDYMLKLN